MLEINVFDNFNIQDSITLELPLGIDIFDNFTIQEYKTSPINGLRTISDAGGNWDSTGAWAEGAVPGTGDFIAATASSGNLSLNVETAILGKIDFTNYVGIFSGGSGNYLKCSGSVTYSSGMTINSPPENVMSGTGTLISNGKNIGSVTVVSGGNVTLGDALSISGYSLWVEGGTFNTANFSITAIVFGDDGSATAKTITLGSSTISVGRVFFYGAGALTVSTNTAHITSTPTGSAYHQYGSTGGWHDVTINGNASYLVTLSGTNTFITLRLVGTASRTNYFEVTANQVITSNLILSGDSGVNRPLLSSSTMGTTRSFTFAGESTTLTQTNFDLRDIAYTGASPTVSSTRVGDCGGNSGTSCSAPKNVYCHAGTNQYSYANIWSLSSGGSVSYDNYPLPQDTAIFDNETWDTSSQSIYWSGPRTSGLDATAFTESGWWYWYGNTTIYGNIETGISFNLMNVGSGGYTITFDSRLQGTQTIRCSPIFNTGGPVVFDSVSGTTKFVYAFRREGGPELTTVLTRGTIDLNGKSSSFTGGGFSSSNTNTRSIINTGGGGEFLVRYASGAGTILDFSTPTNLSVDSTINFCTLYSPGSSGLLSGDQTFKGGGVTFGRVTFGIQSSSSRSVIVQGDNTFNELVFVVPYSPSPDYYNSVKFTSGSITNVGSISTMYESGTGKVIITSTTSSAHTISCPSGVYIVRRCDISYSTAMGGASFYASGSTDSGNNSGWKFIQEVNVYDDIGAKEALYFGRNDYWFQGIPFRGLHRYIGEIGTQSFWFQGIPYTFLGDPFVLGINVSDNFTVQDYKSVNTLTYFGCYINASGEPSQTESSSNNGGYELWNQSAYMCPGSGNQTVQSIGIYCARSNSPMYVHFGLYTAAGDLVCKSVSPKEPGSSDGWVSWDYSELDTNPCVITGGNTYKFMVYNWNGSIVTDHGESGTTATYYAGNDYSGGLPSSIPGGDAPTWAGFAMRCGVTAGGEAGGETLGIDVHDHLDLVTKPGPQPTLTIDLSDSLTVAEYQDKTITIYYVNVGDNVTVAEYQEKLVTKLYIDKYDSLTVLDSAQEFTPALCIIIADSLTVQEVTSEFVTIYYLDVYEGLSVQDYRTVNTGAEAYYEVSVYDRYAVQEYQDKLLTIYYLNVYDGIGVQDYQERVPTPQFVSVSDSLTVQESQDRKLTTYFVSVSDSLTVQESQDRKLATYFVNVSDSVGVSEYQYKFLTVYHVNVYDSASVLDSAQELVPAYNLSVAESLSAQEYQDKQLNPLLIDIFEGLSVVEYRTVNAGEISYYDVSVYDRYAVQEYQDKLLTIYYLNVYDGIGIQEYQGKAVTPLHVNVYDNVRASEAHTEIAIPYHVNVYDSARVSEYASEFSPALCITVADSFSVQEYQGKQLNPLLVGIFEGLSFVEYRTVNTGVESYYDVSVYDRYAVQEYQDKKVNPYFINVYESVTAQESYIEIVTPLYVNVYDNARVSEYQDKLLTVYHLNVYDSVRASESIDKFLSPLFLTASDSITVSESSSITLGVASFYEVSVSENFSVQEHKEAFPTKYYLNVYDNVRVQEYKEPINAFYHVNVYDSVRVQENTTRLIPAYHIEEAEAFTVQESQTERVNPYHISSVESFTVSEASEERAPYYLISSADLFRVSEYQAKEVSVRIDKSDSFAVSESASEFSPYHCITVAEAIDVREYFVKTTAFQYLEIDESESFMLKEMAGSYNLGKVDQAFLFNEEERAFFFNTTIVDMEMDEVSTEFVFTK